MELVKRCKYRITYAWWYCCTAAL